MPLETFPFDPAEFLSEAEDQIGIIFDAHETGDVENVFDAIETSKRAVKLHARAADIAEGNAAFFSELAKSIEVLGTGRQSGTHFIDHVSLMTSGSYRLYQRVPAIDETAMITEPTVDLDVPRRLKRIPRLYRRIKSGKRPLHRAQLTQT